MNATIAKSVDTAELFAEIDEELDVTFVKGMRVWNKRYKIYRVKSGTFEGCYFLQTKSLVKPKKDDTQPKLVILYSYSSLFTTNDMVNISELLAATRFENEKS